MGCKHGDVARMRTRSRSVVSNATDAELPDTAGASRLLSPTLIAELDRFFDAKYATQRKELQAQHAAEHKILRDHITQLEARISGAEAELGQLSVQQAETSAPAPAPAREAPRPSGSNPDNTTLPEPPSYAAMTRGQGARTPEDAPGPQSETAQRPQSELEDSINRQHAAADAEEAALQLRCEHNVFVRGMRAAVPSSQLSEVEATLMEVGCPACPTGVSQVGHYDPEHTTIPMVVHFNCARDKHALYAKSQTLRNLGITLCDDLTPNQRALKASRRQRYADLKARGVACVWRQAQIHIYTSQGRTIPDDGRSWPGTGEGPHRAAHSDAGRAAPGAHNGAGPSRAAPAARRRERSAAFARGPGLLSPHIGTSPARTERPHIQC